MRWGGYCRGVDSWGGVLYNGRRQWFDEYSVLGYRRGDEKLG